MAQARRSCLPIFLAAGALAIAPEASAQATIRGRVVVDSDGVAIPGAEVSMPKLGLRQLASDSGYFRFNNLPPGDHLLRTSAVGFAPDSVYVELDADETLVRDFTLKRITTELAAVRVTAASPASIGPGLRAFEERRKFGIGRFLDVNDLTRWQDRPTGDALGTLPGVDVRRSTNRAYAASSRAVPQLGRTSLQAPCFMDVYLDGAAVYLGGTGQAPFDLNSVRVPAIAAIEVYTSAAQIPAGYNRTSAGCGVILIWTK